MIKSKHVSSL